MRDALQAVLEGRLDPKSLEVAYEDIHPLSGGMSFVLKGDGAFAQKAERRTLPEPRRLTTGEVRDIVKLMLKLEIWEQREKVRSLVPGEIRVYVTVKAGGAESSTWETFRDLAKNDRIARVRDAITRAAWNGQKAK